MDLWERGEEQLSFHCLSIKTTFMSQNSLLSTCYTKFVNEKTPHSTKWVVISCNFPTKVMYRHYQKHNLWQTYIVKLCQFITLPPPAKLSTYSTHSQANQKPVKQVSENYQGTQQPAPSHPDITETAQLVATCTAAVAATLLQHASHPTVRMASIQLLVFQPDEV